MIKILLVDDDEELTEVIKEYMEDQDAEVTVLNSGQQVMQTVKKLKPDVILLDIILPDTTGIQLLKNIRQDPLTSFIPVIMLTGQSSVDSQVEGLAEGADDYITKPFDLNVLYARILSIQRRYKKNTRTKYDQINLLNYLIGVYSNRQYTIYTQLLDEYDDHPDDWIYIIPDLIIQKQDKTRFFNFESHQSILEEQFIDRAKKFAEIQDQYNDNCEGNIIVRTKKTGREASDIMDEYDISLNIKLIERHKSKSGP